MIAILFVVRICCSSTAVSLSTVCKTERMLCVLHEVPNDTPSGMFVELSNCTQDVLQVEGDLDKEGVVACEGDDLEGTKRFANESVAWVKCAAVKFECGGANGANGGATGGATGGAHSLAPEGASALSSSGVCESDEASVNVTSVILSTEPQSVCVKERTRSARTLQSV